MMYLFQNSSSFDALKKSLVGVQKYIQATDLSEASQDAVEEKLRATDRQWSIYTCITLAGLRAVGTMYR